MEPKVEPGFRRRVEGAFGERGIAWLDSLASLVGTCAERWALSRLEPFPEMSYAWVARVRRNGAPAVLKISVPGFESRSEILALENFPADEICRLYAADPEACAILVEELVPGTTLHTVGSFDERIGIARTVFARLHDTEDRVPGPHELAAFPSFTVVASRALGHVAQGLPSGTAGESSWRPRLHAIAGEAIERLETLSTTPADGTSLDTTLIHGDLHHGNILRSADRWKVIDPKGIAGPLWLEPARFMLNQYDAASVDERHTQFDRMSESFAHALGVRTDLVALGSVLDAAVSACWSWEDGAGEQEMMQAVERAETITEFATHRHI